MNVRVCGEYEVAYPKRKSNTNIKSQTRLRIVWDFMFSHANESKFSTLVKTQNPKLSFRIFFAESKGFEPLEV